VKLPTPERMPARWTETALDPAGPQPEESSRYYLAGEWRSEGLPGASERLPSATNIASCISRTAYSPAQPRATGSGTGRWRAAPGRARQAGCRWKGGVAGVPDAHGAVDAPRIAVPVGRPAPCQRVEHLEPIPAAGQPVELSAPGWQPLCPAAARHTGARPPSRWRSGPGRRGSLPGDNHLGGHIDRPGDRAADGRGAYHVLVEGLDHVGRSVAADVRPHPNVRVARRALVS
jgi:hypothetical protein